MVALTNTQEKYTMEDYADTLYAYVVLIETMLTHIKKYMGETDADRHRAQIILMSANQFGFHVFDDDKEEE